MGLAKSPFDDNDGAPAPNRPEWVWGGNTDKLMTPNYGMDGAGNSTLTNLDEREVTSDTTSATPCYYSMPDTNAEWYGNRQGVYAERQGGGY